MAQTQFKTPEDLNISLWQYYTVRLKFRDKIVGGIPKSPSTIANWLNATIEDKSMAAQLIEQTKKETGVAELSDEERAEVEETVWNGFKIHPKTGLYIEGR